MSLRFLALVVLCAVASIEAQSADELGIRNAILTGTSYTLKKNVVLTGDLPVIPAGMSVYIVGGGKKALTIDGRKLYTMFQSTATGQVNLVLKNLNIINAAGTAVDIRAPDSTLDIDKVSFKSSRRAINAIGTVAFVSNSQFSGHSATAVSVLAGGSGQPIFSLSKCKFSSNKADVDGGGALFVGERAFVTASQTTFDSNTSPGTYGGAVRLEEFATGEFSSCTFTKNSASSGGAVGAFNAYFSTFKCTFKGNSAGTGGAIRMTSDGEGTYTHLQSVFNGNKASSNGGAFLINADVDLTICSCKFNSNTAKGVANNGFNESPSSQATIYTLPFTIIPLVTTPPTNDPIEFLVSSNGCPIV